MSHPNVEFPANPYVGPRAFRESERNLFFGRDREIRELADLLIAERIVLLHAPSGAGKTSLLIAGLLPRLEEDFDILPLARVGQNVGLAQTGAATANRYLLSTLLSWETNQATTSALNVNDLASLTLDQYLARRPRVAKPQLLIFDQFEELLTANAYDQRCKEEFFRQVAELLRRPRNAQPQDIRWALFAFREEYLAALQPFFHRIPGITPETYRLDLLGVESAVAAVHRPSEAVGVTYRDDAARYLVDNLRRVHSDRRDSSMDTAEDEVLGAHVEPVQLQVVCFRLWPKLAKASKREVAREDIDQLADVDNALAGYYADKVAEISRANGVSELNLRSWIGDRLITPEGHRAIVQLGGATSQGLDEPTTRALLDTFLIRKEDRRGLSWLELAHDRLIDPIRQDNERWFAQRLQPFQLQANRWQQLGEPPELLLRGWDLIQAERWQSGRSDQLRTIDKRFLEASSRRKVSTVDAIKMSYLRWWAYIATAAVVAVTLYAIVALRNADRQRRDADNYAGTVVQKARKQLRDVEAEKSRIEQESLNKMSLLLRLPMESAARLATAETAVDAKKALDDWEKLFAIMGPIDGIRSSQDSPWLREIERITAEPRNQKLTMETRRQLAEQTLRLSQRYGRQFVLRLSAGDEELLRRLRVQLFGDAKKLTGELAMSLKTSADLTTQKDEIDRFWQLYYGELPVVEGTKVARAMMEFGDALNSHEFGKLSDRAAALSQACDDELSGGLEAL